MWIAALMLLNMGIAMTAEYTAVGDLFELVVGATRVPIVVIIGVVSMLYTAYGGLYVSIVTDQWQARARPVLPSWTPPAEHAVHRLWRPLHLHRHRPVAGARKAA